MTSIEEGNIYRFSILKVIKASNDLSIVLLYVKDGYQLRQQLL
jgi:hypothetical protein